MKETDTLKQPLRRLKMPEVLNNLNLRIKETQDTSLSYLDFLIPLGQSEIANRESNILNKRLKIGELSPQMTFERYDYRFNSEAIISQAICDLATCQFIQDRFNKSVELRRRRRYEVPKQLKILLENEQNQNPFEFIVPQSVTGQAVIRNIGKYI